MKNNLESCKTLLLRITNSQKIKREEKKEKIQYKFHNYYYLPFYSVVLHQLCFSKITWFYQRVQPVCFILNFYLNECIKKLVPCSFVVLSTSSSLLSLISWSSSLFVSLTNITTSNTFYFAYLFYSSSKSLFLYKTC